MRRDPLQLARIAVLRQQQLAPGHGHKAGMRPRCWPLQPMHSQPPPMPLLLHRLPRLLVSSRVDKTCVAATMTSCLAFNGHLLTSTTQFILSAVSAGKRASSPSVSPLGCRCCRCLSSSSSDFFSSPFLAGDAGLGWPADRPSSRRHRTNAERMSFLQNRPLHLHCICQVINRRSHTITIINYYH